VPDLSTRSATALARAIRRREVSAVDVLEAHLRRLAADNDWLRAVVTVDPDAARARAQAADDALEEGRVWGPLHGVPFTVKDQFATAGVRTTYGLPRYRRFVPDTDAPCVRRLRRAGALLLGKTNLPLAAYDWQSDNPQFGRALNPWAPSRTPGGSSGGSAAALAAGFSPLELGADVAGSIRVPSHFCGVAGLRPTEGTLPLDGILPPEEVRTVHHIVVPGPMARTVEDLRLAWQVLTNTDAPPVPAAESLRVAVTPELGDVPVDTDTQRVLRTTVDRLRTAGCTVERRPPPIDIDEALTTWADIQGFELGASLPAPARVPPLKTAVWHGLVRHKFGFLGRRLARGAHRSARGYLAALDRKHRLTRAVNAFLAEWDLWLTPVASIPAFPHCTTGADLSLEGVSVPYALPFAAYNCATAVTGHPILTLPAGRSANGLPIGLQVHARQGRDSALLAAGRCLEHLVSPDATLAPLGRAPAGRSSARAAAEQPAQSAAPPSR
jgi:amidase